MADNFDALHQEILSETDQLAESYRQRFADRPADELSAWLQVALRREALVSDVYGEAQRAYRLPNPDCDAAKVAWDAITLIWQQEVVHTKFIEVRLEDGVLALERGPLATELLRWMGAAEGKMLAALTSRPGVHNTLAKVVRQLGRYFAPEQLPAFALDFVAMDARDFFLLLRTLETTARQSYQRMAELASELASRTGGQGASLQFDNLASELRLKRLDEEFHENAFRAMAGWVTKSGDLDDDLPAEYCVRMLRSLLPRAADEHPPSWTVRSNTWRPEVLTDGGLGKLFDEYGLSVRVVSA